MATRKKKVVDDDYSKLDTYAIELHEYYKSLRKAGFTNDNALYILSAKQTYPEWMQATPTLDEIRRHIDEDED
jgi:hypothetical protein